LTGVAFTRTGNTFAYNLWYNSSQTANVTQDVEEAYGIPLMAFVRGLDEAIGTCATACWCMGRPDRQD